ncbi:MAG: FAD-dependent oxidoreductase [Deltaproteobacteria bacterium]|nr:FAD-dependent oxidoreductase [Deltaproteobacteria bacterium]
MKLEQETIRVDTLIVGGGLAGCMAAIRAGEVAGSAGVLLVEKANVQRSGNAATGVDHTWSYMPEYHEPMGFTIEQLVEDHVKAMGHLQDRDIIFTIASTIKDRLKDMDRWGFPVRKNGEWNYVKKIHRVPTFLHWSGRDQKVLFARQLAERNIRVVNRLVIADLIRMDDRVVGAIGVGVREPKLYVILAKSTVIATGPVARLFPGTTSWEFNRATNPQCTGDGVAMAYRAGAELSGLEFLYLHTGPKNFNKKGRGTWIGITEDAGGKPIGKVREGVDRKKISISVESPGDMRRVYEEGRGPVLMNCSETPDEDMDYMKWALMNEGNVILLKYLDERGIDPKKYLIEFSVYEPELRAGVLIDTKGTTSVKGLFAAGDTIGNIKRGVSPGAFAMGWIAGENAALHAGKEKHADEKGVMAFVNERREILNSFLGRKEGASWKEAMAACQDTMNWYGGFVRYESLLKAGVHNMGKIREESLGSLKASNLHELMHCISALNVMDVGEASMLCALERRESRMTLRENFIRKDFPDENEQMNKMLVLKSVQGKPEFYWREPRSA